MHSILGGRGPLTIITAGVLVLGGAFVASSPEPPAVEVVAHQTVGEPTDPAPPAEAATLGDAWLRQHPDFGKSFGC